MTFFEILPFTHVIVTLAETLVTTGVGVALAEGVGVGVGETVGVGEGVGSLGISNLTLICGAE